MLEKSISNSNAFAKQFVSSKGSNNGASTKKNSRCLKKAMLETSNVLKKTLFEKDQCLEKAMFKQKAMLE